MGTVSIGVIPNHLLSNSTLNTLVKDQGMLFAVSILPSFLPPMVSAGGKLCLSASEMLCQLWRTDVLVKNPPPLENRSPGSVVVGYGEKEDV